MHLKRLTIPKEWPVERKGTKYLISAKGKPRGIPVLIVAREMLNLVRTKKEFKRAIFTGDILVNGRKLKDAHYPISLFDIVTVVPLKKSYRIDLNIGGKYHAHEISEKESKEKIAKIINKRLLKNKVLQLNLSDGRNYLTNIECKVGDSVNINLEKKKIEKVIPIKEGHEALILTGKNAGMKGKIVEIEKEKNKMKFFLEKEKKEIEINPDSIIVIK